jgi:hypothetical protein
MGTWCIPVISPALRGVQREDGEFKAILATYRDPDSTRLKRKEGKKEGRELAFL